MDLSVVIPVYNAERNIGNCLDAVCNQSLPRERYEVIVVDDGSTDGTADIIRKYPGVRLIQQHNQGPAAARNFGASQATGKIVVFTDSDCTPTIGWLGEMTVPFESDPTIVGVKGAYRTNQRSLVARFAQLEYEDKYRLLSRTRYVDFIDTYAAAYDRELFMSFRGFDLNFRRAANEDVDLSYRISNQGHHLFFNPRAIVYHIHPARLMEYIRKKYLYAYWRMLALRNNPNKIIIDSHTPQLTKMQPFLITGMILAGLMSLWWAPWVIVSALLGGLFLLATMPFILFSFKRDKMVAVVAVGMIAGRALAHWWGICRGAMTFFLFTKRRPR
ncbi:MAG: glycosyltransferase [bacterium]|nr:glycosyltransferase [bacterium]